MCFFQKFYRDVLFVSPVEITILFSPVKHALQYSVSLNAFAPKIRTRAVIMGALAVRIYNFLLTVLLEQGFPSFCFPCTN